jgi:hypothetical protein
MALPEITPELIAQHASGPQSSAGDGESASRFSISAQIEADRYAKSQQAQANGVFPLGFQKLKRPGTA